VFKCVEVGGEIKNLKIGEAEKRECGLAISPPRFSRFCKRAFLPDFFEEKKLAGTLVGHPLPKGKSGHSCSQRAQLVGVTLHGLRGPKLVWSLIPTQKSKAC
jgi:hypothetical protein